MYRPFRMSLRLAAAFAITAAPFVPGLAVTGTPNGALLIRNLDDAHTGILLDQPEILRVDTTIGFRTGELFRIDGEAGLTREGEPILPRISRFYRIADVGEVQLTLRDLEFEIIHDVDVLPYSNEPGQLAQSDAIYSLDEWYPASPVEISEPMIMRDFRVVQLTLYPVQYNPVTHDARVYNRMEIDLATTDEPGANENMRSQQPSGVYAPVYRAMLPNLDPVLLDDATATPGGYLILCREHQVVRPWADSLATWKRMQGFDVVVDARPTWTLATMITAVQTAYATWDPPLEYVMILGDPQEGSIGMPTHPQDYDHAFTLGNPQDQLSDLAVGRLTCRSAAEFATVWRKLMLYEREPELADAFWTHRALLWATTQGTGGQNNNLVYWARDQFLSYTNVDSFVVGVGMPSNQIVYDALNSGVSLFLWMGGWGAQMPDAFVSSLDTTSKLPVVFLVNEWTGRFANETGLAELFTIAGTAAAPRGAVAAIGTVSELHAPETNTLGGGLMQALCNFGIPNVGITLFDAEYELFRVFGFENSWAMNIVKWTNLFGDPSLQIWTDRVHEFVVEYEPVAQVGTNCIDVNVFEADGIPVENALVVLWKLSEIHAKVLTDADGRAVVPAAVQSEGPLTLCVSKHNFKPYIGTIDVTSAEYELVTDAYFFDDDNIGGSSGNGDSLLNPGEIVDIPLEIRNVSTAWTSHDISVALTCANSHVELLVSESEYPDLPPGEHAPGATPFRIRLHPEMRLEECVTLVFDIRSGEDSSCGVITSYIHAGSAAVISHVVSGGDGDGQWEPGEQVNLQLSIANFGDVIMPSVVCELSSRTGYAVVVQSFAEFGDVAPNVQEENEIPFVLRAQSSAFRGMPIELRAVIQDESGLIDTLTVTIPLGIRPITGPTGPDAYGYYAYENIDTSFAQHREFAWIDVRANGDELGFDDPGEEIGSAVYSTVSELPFPFTFYGEEYSQITICSNGWAAFGDHIGNDISINYPIPGQQAPGPMLAPMWDDLMTSGQNGVWARYDPEEGRYVIQWRARTVDPSFEQEFEILILDPMVYPTRSGDGMIVFQYNLFAESEGHSEDVAYCTVGIQAGDGRTGLQFRYGNLPAAGADEIEAGRAVVFTTDAPAGYGGIHGTVTDAGSGLPIAGAYVVLQEVQDSAETNAEGMYDLPLLLSQFYTLRVRAEDYHDTSTSEILVIVDSVLTLDFALTPLVSAPPEPIIPIHFSLAQNYPNPFNAQTGISFSLPQTADASLVIYDLLGKEVAILVSGVQAAGTHHLTFDARELGSGVYFYRLSHNKLTETRKLVLLK